MNSKRFIKGTLLVLAAGTMWGIYGCLSQYLFSNYGVSTEWYLAVKMMTAGVIMVAINLFLHKGEAFNILRDKKLLPEFILFIIFGSIGVQYTYLLAVRFSNAATATAIQYTEPVIVMLWLALRSKKCPSAVEMVCVLLAVFGTFMISTHGNPTTLCISPISLIVGLISACTLAAYALQPSRLIKKHGSFSLIGWSMLISGIILTLVFRIWTLYVPLDLAAWGIILITAVFGAFVPFTIFLMGVALIGGTRASIFANIEPVVSAVIAFGILGSPYTAADIIGITAILSTVLILTLSSASTNKVSG